MKGLLHRATVLLVAATLLGPIVLSRHGPPPAIAPAQAAGALTARAFLPLVVKAQLGGTVAGQVTSLVDDRPLVGATVCAAESGICDTTDGDGNYSLATVPPGPTTLRAQLDPTHLPRETQVSVAADSVAITHFALAPALPEGESQIVVRWDSSLSPDLDAMLWLPYAQAYVVYADADHRGLCSAVDWPRACWSDTPAAFGNYRYETISLRGRYEGTYTLAVRDAAGAALPPAVARVRVFDAGGQVPEFNTPTAPGSWWYVFDLDGASGAVRVPPGSTDGFVHIMNPGPYGDIVGRVTSQVAGQALPGAVVCRANPTECATSDEDGYYTLANHPTNASLAVSALEHVTTISQGVPPHEGLQATLDFALQPAVPDGQLLIGLQWNQSEIAEGLAAHLWLPYQQQAHVYPASVGNCDAFPHACLRMESRGEVGAQTVRIAGWYVGEYVFAVNHPYRAPGEVWAAHIRLFDANGLLPGGEFDVPAGFGSWWHVFNISAHTAGHPEIIVKNELRDSSPAPY